MDFAPHFGDIILHYKMVDMIEIWNIFDDVASQMKVKSDSQLCSV